MDIDWKAIFAHPLMNMLFGALIGYIPMHIKDKRELASKERLAAEERIFARENTRQAKAYEERKHAYAAYLQALHEVVEGSLEDDKKNVNSMVSKRSSLIIVSSEEVRKAAEVASMALHEFLKDSTANKVKNYNTDKYKRYGTRYNTLVDAMRLDLGVHQTELC